MMRMDRDDGRLDLSPLGLASDPERMERLVGRIMAAAEPELRQRAAARDPFSMLQAWARPVLAAAAMISVLALGLLEWQRSSERLPQFVGVAEALEIAGPAYEWLIDEREPDDEDMMVFLEDPTL